MTLRKVLSTTTGRLKEHKDTPWIQSMVEKKCILGKSSLTKVRKWRPSVSQAEIEKRVVVLESMGFKGKELGSLLPSVVKGTDVINRLELVVRSCVQAGFFDLAAQRGLVNQQKRWLFHCDSEGFKEKLDNLLGLLHVYRKNKVDLKKWVIQLSPASKGKLEETISFLVKLAGSERVAQRMIQIYPLILQFDVDKYLVPRLELLKGLGFSEGQLAKILMRFPRIFSVAREDRITSMVVLLRELGLSNDDVCKVISSYPRLSTSTCKAVSERLEYFVSCGVGRDMLWKLIKKNPSLLSMSVENGLKPKLEFLKSIGVTGKDLVNLLSLHAGVLARNRGGLEARFNRLMRLGLTRDECSYFFKRHPSIFNLRDELLDKKVEFYTKVIKQPLKSMVRFPSFLTYSLDVRLKPRIAFRCWLYQSGLAKREYMPSYFLALTERNFVSKFLTNPELAEIYYKCK